MTWGGFFHAHARNTAKHKKNKAKQRSNQGVAQPLGAV
jgi:hypothetical protein